MNYSVDQIIKAMLILNFTRYLLAAAPAFLIFYVWKKKAWGFKKIQSPFTKNQDYYREIGYSVFTMLIFSMVGFFVVSGYVKPYTRAYLEVSQYGWAYLGLSIVLMIFLHDTYFYWTHRLMHHPKLFKYFHLVHHKSTNPSPWAAYAFHPLEAIVEASIIFLIVFLIPFHKTALLTFLLFMIFYNVYGHLGFELYPKGFHKHRIGKWINTSVNHNLHHRHFEGNFGLYFLFWDRWIGTVRADYDSSFDQIDEKRHQAKSLAGHAPH